MSSPRQILGFALLAFVVALPPAAPSWAAQETQSPRSSELVLGRVSNNPRKDHPGLQALGDYLAAELRQVGVSHARVQFAADGETMTALLDKGEVDLAFDTVFAALSYQRDAGANLLLREWRDGRPTYRSVLFKRRDLPLSSLGDLTGRVIAFERPSSTTGYFVPRAELMAGGLQLMELADASAPLPPRSVGYVFAGSENNLVVWVHRRLVSAGAFSDIDWEQSEDMPPALKQDLEIFHYSAPLPRALVIGRARLPADLAQRIVRLLLTADRAPAGAAALAQRHVTRYDELTGDAAHGVAAARSLMAAFGS